MTFPYPHGALPVGAAPYALPTGTAERVLLLSPRNSDLGILSASTAVTTLPVTNLQNPEPSKKWRSTSTVGQYIDITLASGLGCNAAALVGHNLSGAGLWRVSDADREGKLPALLNPDLTPPERAVAQVEGWILGVGGTIGATIANHFEGASTTRH